LVSVQQSISRPIFEVSLISKAIGNKVLILGTSIVLPPPGVRSEKKTERDRYIEENVSPDKVCSLTFLHFYFLSAHKLWDYILESKWLLLKVILRVSLMKSHTS
jgi:hypothetical protein